MSDYDARFLPGRVQPVVRGDREARKLFSLTKAALDQARQRGVMSGAKMVIDSLRIVVPHHADALGGLLHVEELFELLDEAEETICGKASNTKVSGGGTPSAKSDCCAGG